MKYVVTIIEYLRSQIERASWIFIPRMSDAEVKYWHRELNRILNGENQNG